MATREGMAQRAVAIHFPDVNPRADYKLCIFDYHSESDACAHPFLARLRAPAELAARWNTSPVGGVRGEYIVGKYQAGLGGDFAYASAGRCDPKSPEDGFTPADMAEIRIPLLGEIDGVYLWHCGSPPAASWRYETLIINLEKIWADTDPVNLPVIRVQANSLAQPDGNGNLSYTRRYYGHSTGGDDPTFTIDADGVVDCDLPLVGTVTGTYPASLAYEVNLYI